MPRFHRIEPRLAVADLARSLGFYRDLLGFAVEGPWPADHPEFAILDRDGVRLQLVDGLGAGGASPGGGIVWLDVAGVAALYEVIRPSVPIDWGPEVYTYGRREFAVRDPDGNQVIFSEATDDPPTCEEA